MERDAHHVDLAERMQDLIRVVRRLRQRRVEHHPSVPAGTVGTLLQIERMSHASSGCHAKELAARSGLDPSTVSRSVTALVADGLVERRPDPHDGRASVLAVTDAGRTALAEARAWYTGLLDRALADWSPAEIGHLDSLLGRLVTDLGGALDSHRTDHTLEAAR